MRSLVEWSLRFRLLVVMAAAGLMIVGVAQLRDAPVDVLPEFAPPYVEIQTEALGLSAEEVEEFVTVPLEEQLLNGVAGIETIRSESVLGLSSITLVFEKGTKILDARQLVQERLTQAHALPNVSKPPTMLQPLSAANRVMMIGLSSQEISPLELGLLARWTLKPRLLGIEGVAQVNMWGHRDHQLQVQVSPQRLREAGVTLQQVVSTAGNAQLVSPLSFLEASTPGASGFIDTPSQRLQVRHVLPITQPEGLAQVPLEGVPGGGKTLGDVAIIREDYQPLIGDALVGGDTGLMLVVEKFPGANTLQVTRDIEAALDSMRPGLSGVEIDSNVFRPATYIERALESLQLALLIGGALLVATLIALFLLDWRLAVVTSASIALSLVAAALALYALGEPMHALVLAGLVLAVAVVVDDAVSGADAGWRRLRERRPRDEESLAAAIVEAMLASRRPAIYALAIVLLAGLPLFFLPSPADAFFEPLAISYGIAVAVSMIVALTATPALAMVVLRGAKAERAEPSQARWVTRRYEASLTRVVSGPRVILAATAVAVALAVVFIPRLGIDVVPTFKETELLVHVDGAPGTSRPAMLRISSQIAKELRGLDGVENVGVHVGRAVTGDEVAGINSGELWVSLDPDRDHDEMVSAVRNVVAGYPGLDGRLVTYSNEQIRAVGAVVDGNEGTTDGLGALLGKDEPVTVRVYGASFGVLRREAEKVRRAIGEIDGIVDPRVERRTFEPAVRVLPDLERAAQHGLKPGDIRRAAATMVQGIVVGSLFEEQKVFDVVVVGEPSLRHSVSDIRGLLIDTPSGGTVPLSEVADVRIAPTPTSIEREASSRKLDVVAGISGRSLPAVLDDVEDAVQGLSFPLEYHARVVAESRERQAAATRAAIVAGLVLLATYLVLQAAFGSWRVAAVFLAALPLGLVGGLVAASGDGGTLSLGSLLGLVAVFTLMLRNGVQFAAHCKQIEVEEGVRFGPELVLRGAQERLRPVLTSALALVAIFLPFAILGARPGYEIVHPMAIVLIGGLVTATPLSLYLVPAVYRRYGSTAEVPAAAKVEAAPTLLQPGG